jgi:hypothetical protein
MKLLHSLGLAAIATLALTAGACAATLTYVATLSGAAEEPPNASPGFGNATVQYDDVAQTFRVAFDWSGLIGTTTAAHIHGPTATPGSGVAGVITTVPSFVGFPLGVTSGAFDTTLDATAADTYNPAFLMAQGNSTAAAETALAAILAAGTGYLNVHSSEFPMGEIRGFLAPIPLPATILPLLTGLIGLAALGRARRRARAA